MLHLALINVELERQNNTDEREAERITTIFLV